MQHGQIEEMWPQILSVRLIKGNTVYLWESLTEAKTV